MTREEAINHLGTYRFRGINHTTAEFIPAPDVWQEAMNMAIAALREQPSWIPVDERLPEPDTDVLARRSIGTMDVEVYHEDEVAWTWDGYSKGFVTHWMPLPEPPKEEGK